MYVMHGVADAIAGPYAWFKEPSLPGGINPAFLAYTDRATGAAVYSLWDGDIRIADSPALRNFTSLGRHAGGCGGNPAPARAKSAFAKLKADRAAHSAMTSRTIHIGLPPPRLGASSQRPTTAPTALFSRIKTGGT